jgi:hypothetical protein
MIGVLGFDSRRGLGVLLFTTASRTALGPTQCPIKWVPEALSVEVKRPEREVDHSFPSSAEVKNAWSYTSTPQYALMAWCSVNKGTGTTLPLHFYLIYAYVSEVVFSLQVFRLKFCMHFSDLPCMLRMQRLPNPHSF